MKAHSKEKLFAISGMGLLIVGIVLISTFLIGCNNKGKEKTIIIPEKKTQGIDSKIFETAKIVKIKQGMTTRGWVDKNNILLLAEKSSEDNSSEYLNEGIHKWLEVRKADFNTNNYENIIKNKIVMDAAISPDKSKIAYIESLKRLKSFEDTKQVIVKNLSTGKETFITSLNRVSDFNWSNNSRYLSIVKTNMLVIYDTSTDKVREFNINGFVTRIKSTQAKLSNDGNHVLINSNLDLYLFDVSGDSITFANKEELEKTKIVSSNYYSFQFYDNTKILYTAGKGEITALYTYDMNTGKKNPIMDDVVEFSISPNKKNIAYYKHIATLISVGCFDGTSITNDTIVFKGRSEGALWWNDDNNKILFYGELNDSFDNFVLEVK
ncbi:hypothetical protein [Clostridium sp.]|uniref:hypothetical protein n=1 Tax=Clostridium sp. TaxID=1506 RepID=UPI003D6D8AB5